MSAQKRFDRFHQDIGRWRLGKKLHERLAIPTETVIQNELAPLVRLVHFLLYFLPKHFAGQKLPVFRHKADIGPGKLVFLQKITQNLLLAFRYPGRFVLPV